MTYVLGAAPTTNAPLRMQFTVRGDGFESLARAYGFPDPAGKGASAILTNQLQDPFFKAALAPSGRINSSANVQNWIKSLRGWDQGAKNKFSAKNNPGTNGPDGKPEGHAFFTDDTKILLPDMPRLDGKKPKSTTGVPAPSAPPAEELPELAELQPDDDVKEAGFSPLLAVGGLFLLGLLLLSERKDKKKKAAGAKA